MQSHERSLNGPSRSKLMGCAFVALAVAGAGCASARGASIGRMFGEPITAEQHETVAVAEPSPGLAPESVQTARIPERHRALADAYAKKAEDLRAKALVHRHMDSSYSEPGYLSAKLGLPRHCRALTLAYETAAKEANGRAEAHRAMADEAGARKGDR